MQTYIIKLLIFFYFTIAILFITNASTPKKNIEADSLFKVKSYSEALLIYESIFNKGSFEPNPSIYLKVAAITEKFNDIPKTLYYLSLYNSKNPNIAVLAKIKTLANLNNNTGYESNDLSTFISTLSIYYNYLILFFLLIGLFLFAFLFSKFLRKERFLKRHSIILIIYFLLLILLINLPSTFSSIIIKNNNANLKNAASGASKTIKVFKAGDKLNFYGKNDIWCRVIWEGQNFYINENDCWFIN